MRMPPLSSLAALAAAVLTMAGVSYAKALTYTLPEETATRLRFRLVVRRSTS
jgi:hypothetical protein